VEVAVAYFNAISEHLYYGTDEGYENSKDGQSLSQESKKKFQIMPQEC
jgi:hypothetical protein